MLNVGIMDALMINSAFIFICIHSTNGKIPVLILYAYLKLSTADELMINIIFYLYFDSFNE